MIGNDVIDILQSRKESNWQRKGFIQKLFTIEEQLLISNAPDPEIMVWMLWSMKEAAYKIYNRQTKVRAYIPQKLVCSIASQNLNFTTGNVTCYENNYHTKTFLSEGIIHTIAVSTLDNFNHVIEIENKSIIKDQNGIPYLVTSSQNTVQDVSISHHGRFEKVVTISTL
jgi:phosphopantetheinyl transferase (holo-ACP synthase)